MTPPFLSFLFSLLSFNWFVNLFWKVKARPPTFVLFCNRDVIAPSYTSFLRNQIQRDFKLHGVPLRFHFRRSVGKDADPLKLSFAKKKWVRSKGESRPVGPKRFNRYLEFQRKLRQNERRRKQTREKRRKKGNRYINLVKRNNVRRY